MTKATLLLLAGLTPALASCDQQDALKPDEDITPTDPAAPEGAAAPEGEQAATAGQQAPAVDEGVVEERAEDKQEAMELAQDAANTLKKMKTDARLKDLIGQAKGVFIVPAYGRGAAGVGVRGGEGVLLTHRDGKWSDPAFYDLGGISLGAQLGAEGGEIAMLLMSDEAVNSFKQENEFSLNADAKLTLIDYSALAQAKLGGDENDVIFWSDTEGAFAGAALSVTDINWDDEENPAYYGKPVSPGDVLERKVTGPKGPLQQELTGL